MKKIIHCITNPISINQCANAVIALGYSPVMAEHPSEVAEITEGANALLINTGNITDVRIKSATVSAEIAYRNGVPWLIDAVGAGCSAIRREFVRLLQKEYKPQVIKGNYSEINALCDVNYKTSGIDSEKIPTEVMENRMKKLSKLWGCIILASGKTDIVTDGESVIHIQNGCEELSKITGTGCMLGAITACCIADGADVFSVSKACSILGICGELSRGEKGSGSFQVKLIDNLSLIDEEIYRKYVKQEVIT